METRSSQYLLGLKWLLVLVLLASGMALAEISPNHAEFITVEPPIDIAIEPNEIFEPRFTTETTELTLPAGDTLATQRQVAYSTRSIQAGFSLTPLHDVQIRSYQILGAPLQPGTTATIEIEVVNFASQPTGIMAVDFLFQKNPASPTRLISLPAGGASTLDFDWEIPFYTPGPNDLAPLYFLSFIVSEDKSEQNIENDRLDLSFGFKRNDGTFTLLNNTIVPLHKVEIPVHQWIAKEAYDYFVSQIEGADIGSYLGTISGSHGDNRNTLLEGTAAEDKSDRPPLYQWCPFDGYPDCPYLRHYCAGADGSEIYDGLFLGYDSAFEQAENIWPHTLSAYPTNKALAFYYLGHVAHLLVDMTVPAHTHNDQHAVWDSYEEAMAYQDQYTWWYYGCTRSGDWDYRLALYADLYSIFYRTINYTEDYDSDDKDGDSPPYYNPPDYPNTEHRPDEVDRSGGLSSSELTIIADDLMPYAIRRVADLYRLFYSEVDSSDPTSTMTYPSSEDGSNPDYRTSTSSFDLTASASDPESGIKKKDYKFRYHYYRNGSWSDWDDVTPSPTESSVFFTPPYNNALYSFYVKATNGGGKITSSTRKYVYIDATNPSTPTITGYASSNHNATLVSNNEYAYPNPHFHFSAADGGSGIKGYYYYWGTNASGNPSTWNTSGEYTASGLTSGNDYYFRVKAKDKAGNIGGISTFTYKYRISYTITATPGLNGSISPSGTIVKNRGENQEFTATPNACYTVDKWYLDWSIAQTGGTTYLLSNIRSDHSVHVTFKRLQFTIAASAGPNGSISPSGSIVRNCGENQQFTATPETNYVVDQWYLDGSSVQTGGTTYTLSNIQSDHSVYVTFKYVPPQYTITASAAATGSISPSGTIVKNVGENQQFTATPNTNYAVDQWYLDGSSVQTGGSSYTLSNIQSDHTVHVTFKYVSPQYTITASAGANGSISPSASIVKNASENQQFTATPDTNYVVDQWYLDGNPVQIGNTTYTLHDIQSDHTVEVTFKMIPSVIYVDVDAALAGDGTSWGTAYKYLQDALANATSGDKIWVAKGIYKPDQGVGIAPDDREATFQLINGVAVKGGYAGLGEPDPNARNIKLYETILSGDIGAPGDNSDNCYHVLYHWTGTNLNASAVLDRFIITAGNANASFPHNCGGGMYNDGSSPTVTNCTFSTDFRRALSVI